jgi:hypothetical protein
MAVSALEVFGVALLGRPVTDAPLAPGTQTIVVRDLGAIARPGPYAPVRTTEESLLAFQRVIDAAFLRGAVLPMPCGVVFRGAERVRHWLEQNYIALSEALHFIAGKCESRVHVVPREGLASNGKTPAELSAMAADAFRRLHRSVTAAVPLRHEDGRELLSAGFLIPVEQWAEFSEQVREEERRNEALEFQMTGPWPPYDFVRMEFGE